jgi:nucleoside-diphosphate-sugar epimerase
MKIVVVGGSGFIGTRLVSDLVQAGHDVAIYDLAASARHPGRVTLGDVRDTAALTRALAGADCVVNLAAEHRDDVRPESRYFDVNVNGAASLIAAARANSVHRIVFVSSVAVYGLDQPDADETARITPVGGYGRSKAEAEDVYRDWQSGDDAHMLLLLRPCVVFGEGNCGNVYNLIEQIRRRRFLMIGSGANRKSMAYVGNMVGFLHAQLEAPPGLHLYNYADKPDKNMVELAAAIGRTMGRSHMPRLALPYWLAYAIGAVCDAVAALTGRSLPVSRARVRKFCADTRINADAAQRTGYTPACTIDEGLARMIAALDASRPG